MTIANRAGASGQLYFEHPSHRLETELTWNPGAGVHEIAWRKEGTSGSPADFRYWIAGDEYTIAHGSAFAFAANTLHFLYFDADTDTVAVTTSKTVAQGHDRIIIKEFTTPAAGSSSGADPGGTNIV